MVVIRWPSQRNPAIYAGDCFYCCFGNITMTFIAHVIESIPVDLTVVNKIFMYVIYFFVYFTAKTRHVLIRLACDP